MGDRQSLPMKLMELFEDYETRTQSQVKESSMLIAKSAMKTLVKAVGDIDYRSVRHEHGERLVQYCLDDGQTPATAAKKIRHIKRIFQLCVQRGQLDDNPFRWVKTPKYSPQSINVLDSDAIIALLRAANSFVECRTLDWDLLLRMALGTAMRRGELLNLTWSDIDTNAKTATVPPKADTDSTWAWGHGHQKTPRDATCL
ncbi:tyrosine-type recombinase/integrase [Anaerohalosphaera lusitana]